MESHHVIYSFKRFKLYVRICYPDQGFPTYHQNIDLFEYVDLLQLFRRFPIRELRTEELVENSEEKQTPFSYAPLKSTSEFLNATVLRRLADVKVKKVKAVCISVKSRNRAMCIASIACYNIDSFHCNEYLIHRIFCQFSLD